MAAKEMPSDDERPDDADSSSFELDRLSLLRNRLEQLTPNGTNSTPRSSLGTASGCINSNEETPAKEMSDDEPDPADAADSSSIDSLLKILDQVAVPGTVLESINSNESRDCNIVAHDETPAKALKEAKEDAKHDVFNVGKKSGNPKDNIGGRHSMQSSSVSSHSLSRSYKYSLGSIDSRHIPDQLDKNNDTRYMIPQYSTDSTQYRWPNDDLPLDGEGRFDEDSQWHTVSDRIGHGASGECYIIQLKATEHQNTEENEHYVCVKKVHRYNSEEIRSMYLAGNSCFKKELNGTVDDLIVMKKENGEFLDKVDYLTDVISALYFLHGKGILHNDVKASNVLLDRNGLKAKLADFGSASPYMKDDVHSKQEDIWKVCQFLIEMLGNSITLEINPRLVRPEHVRKLLPFKPDQHTSDILTLFIKNDNNIYTKIQNITSNYLEGLNKMKKM